MTMKAPELARLDNVLIDSDCGVVGVVAVRRGDLVKLRNAYQSANNFSVFAFMAFASFTLSLIALLASGTITIVWN
jgi:hypothetical protein